MFACVLTALPLSSAAGKNEPLGLASPAIRTYVRLSSAINWVAGYKSNDEDDF